MSKICKYCGGNNPEGASNCKFCRAPLPAERPSAPSYTQTQQQPMGSTFSFASSILASQNSSRESYDIFALKDWYHEWDNALDMGEVGIILTNTKGASDLSGFKKALDSYIKYKLSRDISYFLLDLSTQKVQALPQNPECEDVVDLLMEIYQAGVPNYLMIVGDETVIPRIRWDNEASDDDEVVPSDLPYITLNTESPWDGVDYDFDDITQVGRIPANASTNFRNAIAYFNNAQKAQTYKSATAFAYSADSWKATSAAEFKPINARMIVSPPYTSEAALSRKYGLSLLGGVSSAFNLLCFNLHGSDASHSWYGEASGVCIPAFNASLLPKDAVNGYVICSEACYGARPNISDGEDSIVRSALNNGCLGFVGSTRIAYGMGNGDVCAADIIAGVFSGIVAAGATLGEAFILSLKALTLESDMDDVDLKTLAEFALYGDPSCRLVNAGAKKAYNTKSLNISRTKADRSHSFSLFSCDGGNGGFALYSMNPAEQAKLELMSQNVRSVGKQYVMSNFSSMSDATAKVYKVVGANGFRSVYSKQIGDIKSIVMLHLDDNGNVQKAYISK